MVCWRSKFQRGPFNVYDQDDRAALKDAYHPFAMFSMSAAYPPGTTSHGTSRLTHYQVDARNLKLILQPKKRMSFLKQSNDVVVSFLNDLPKTKHDLNSVSLDVPFSSERLITATVTGSK